MTKEEFEEKFRSCEKVTTAIMPTEVSENQYSIVFVFDRMSYVSGLVTIIFEKEKEGKERR